MRMADYDKDRLMISPDALTVAKEAAGFSWNATQQTVDLDRLVNWLRANTKIDAREDNAIDAAINLLETARLMAQHLTPAVMHILKSALDALRSAGVDVGELGKDGS
jgi:hypothetical protein